MNVNTGEIVSGSEVEKLDPVAQRKFEMVGDFTHQQIDFLQNKCHNRVQRRRVAKIFRDENKKNLLKALKE